MNTKQYDDTYNFSKWNADRFDGTTSAYIGFDLAPFRNVADGSFPLEIMDDRHATQFAQLFRNRYNQFCYGSAARRHNKHALVVVALHWLPHWHLHIIVEIPDHKTMEQVDAFTQSFVEYESWAKPSLTGAYCEPTGTILGSLIYNTKFGPDSIIVF